MKDSASFSIGLKHMVGFFVIAAVSAPWKSLANEKVDAGDQNNRFRCEVILPQREWDIPVNSTDSTKIEFALRITNTSTTDLLVGRYMALRVLFRDATGRELEEGGFAYGAAGPRTADYRVLSPGDSTSFKINMSLGFMPDGSLFLGGPDGYGAWRAFYPEGPGAYGIRVKYQFTPEAGFRIPGPYGTKTSLPVDPKHLVPIEFTSEILAVTIKSKKHEQGGGGQPATLPESKSEGSDKPQPTSEGRSR